jgi:DNA-directed RNA polymerase subunit M/transcription elongation factor TFIIS
MVSFFLYDMNLSFVSLTYLNSSNMLYPKEDKVNSTLQYVCRHCFWSEPASSACIFRNNLNNSVGETAGVTQDVGSDPTVGREYYFCILCGEEAECVECSVCGEVQSGGIYVRTQADEIREEYQEFATTIEGRVAEMTA